MAGKTPNGLAPLALFAIALPCAALQSTSQDAEAAYYRAYHLENEEGRYGEALELYREAAEHRSLDTELRHLAEAGVRAMQEELASSDLAALVPADSILYFELNEPGDQLAALLDQLGLLGTLQDALAKGPDAVAISPHLIQGLLGIRGMAAAITGVPMGDGQAPGVLVLHPGNLDLVRGLIETAVPFQGTAVDSIGGHPTWNFEGQAFVTITSRLVIASAERDQIEGVVRRLQGNDSDSLAASRHMREALALRGDDLFFFCLNAEPVRPMLTQMLDLYGSQMHEAAMARALFDPESLRTVVARGGVGSDGITMDVALDLDEGHRNLAFNFVRPVPIDERTLRLVPGGAAAFLAGAFNPPGPAIAPLPEDRDGNAIITARDLGREVFANMVGVSLFAMPQTGGSPIPEVACVISANDPSRTRAMWDLFLGFANLMSSGVTMEPQSIKIAGSKAQLYTLPEGIPLYLVTDGNELILSPSQGLIEEALHAKRQGSSVLDDRAFRGALSRVDQDTTFAFMAHAGRVLQSIAPHLAPEEAAQILPIADMIQETVLGMTTKHSDTRVALSLGLWGVPQVERLVSQAVAAQKGQWGGSQGGDSGGGAPGGDMDAILATFDALALEEGRFEDAEGFARKVAAKHEGDSTLLNNLAWALLTEERYGDRFTDLAREISLTSNEASGYAQWQYLDTLALAEFKCGRTERACELERMALEHAGDTSQRGEIVAALERFEAALGEDHGAEKHLRAAASEHDDSGWRAKDPLTKAVPKKEKKEKHEAWSAEVTEWVDSSAMREKFDALALEKGKHGAAREYGNEMLSTLGDEHLFLNNFAWALLTEKQYGDNFTDLAMKMSKVSNESTDFGRWEYLDTLAWAYFKKGDAERAIELEKKALEIAGDNPQRGELMEAFETFKAGGQRGSGYANADAYAETAKKKKKEKKEMAEHDTWGEVAERLDSGAMREKFDALALDKGEHGAAIEYGHEMLSALGDEHLFLNNLAWALLTEDQYGDDYTDLALKMSKVSNEATEFGRWEYLDTLAWAYFKKGDPARAIELEKKAIELAGDNPQSGELTKALQRFKQGRGEAL